MSGLITRLILVLGITMSARTWAADLYVDPSGTCADLSPCYRTINAAIHAASTGSPDTINLFVATYDELVVIDRPLVLKKSPIGNPPGNARPRIAPSDHSADAVAIYRGSGPVVIEGLEIDAVVDIEKTWGASAIAIYGASGNELRNVTIAHNILHVSGSAHLAGIAVDQARNLAVIGNRIAIDNTIRATGVTLSFSSHCLIAQNTISNGNRAGLISIADAYGTANSIVGNNLAGPVALEYSEKESVTANVGIPVENPYPGVIWLGNSPRNKN